MDFEYRHCSSSPVILIFEAEEQRRGHRTNWYLILETGHCAFVTRLFSVTRAWEGNRRGEERTCSGVRVILYA